MNYELSTEDIKVLKSIKEKYGDKVTIGDLLSNIKSTHIRDIVFSVYGHNNGYCYECSGESFSIVGTISKIFDYETLNEVSEEPKDGFVKLTDKCDDRQLKSIADLLLGEGLDHEPCREFDDASQSSPVEKEDIIEYLKTLYVEDKFEYSDFEREY